jgi:hypothetical protein
LGARAVTRSPTAKVRSPLAGGSSPPSSPLTRRRRWARRLSWRRVLLRRSTIGWSRPSRWASHQRPRTWRYMVRSSPTTWRCPAAASSRTRSSMSPRGAPRQRPGRCGCWSRWVVVSSGVSPGWRSHSTRNMPPAAMAPCWAGSPMRRTAAPGSVAIVMSVSRARSCSVEASSMTRIVFASRAGGFGVGVGEVPGNGLALDAGRGCEGAGGFALHRRTEDAVAGGSPRFRACSDGGGLAGAGPTDRGLEPVPALAPRPSPGRAVHR